MKKALSLMLALALCVALAVPALAVDTFSYGPVTVLDGGSAITFSQAATATRDIMLSRQIWYTGYAAPSYSESTRTTVNLIITMPGSAITRTQSGTPMNLSYLSRVNAGYVLLADRFVAYPTAFTSDQLFAGALSGAELCLLTLSDGTEYYIMSGATALVEAPAVPITYTVQSGDTLDHIALNYYGRDNLGKYLREANQAHFAATGGMLEAGRPLTLPVSLNGVARLSAPLATGREMVYAVKAGDTLASISQRFYGDVKYVNDIFLRNSNQLRSPGMLSIGQVLVLPVINVSGVPSTTTTTPTATGTQTGGGMNYDEH